MPVQPRGDLRAQPVGELITNDFHDVQPDYRTAHYLDGFGYRDRKFRFKPDWPKVPSANEGPMGPWAAMPALPDYWDVLDNADAEHPFRLATSPARSFLNSTFNETPGSHKKEGRPTLMLHPDDAARLGVAAGQEVVIGNRRGSVHLHAVLFEGVVRGVVIAESIWPNAAHRHGRGINTITGADAVAPFGGAAFHDNKVWIRAA